MEHARCQSHRLNACMLFLPLTLQPFVRVLVPPLSLIGSRVFQSSSGVGSAAVRVRDELVSVSAPEQVRCCAWYGIDHLRFPSRVVTETYFPGESSRMEGPNMPWEMDEYPTEETKKMTVVDWMMHKGLSIGKKMLVVGIVISSAPVVLPPLIVVSALGFAVSLPYGIILASYTCTEKLLNKLLPETSPRHSPKEDDFASAYEKVDEDDEFNGALNVEEEQVKKSGVVKDLDTRTRMSIPSKEPNEEVVMGYGETNWCSRMTEQAEDKRIGGVFLTAEASEHDHDKSGIVAASVEITDAENLVPTNNKMSDHGEMETVTEEKSNGKEGKKKGRKKEKVDEKKLPKASDDITEIKSGVVQAVTAGTDEKQDQPNHSKDVDKIKTSESVAVHSLPGVTAPTVAMNSAWKLIFPSPDQGMYTEEGIWQKIDTMRRIVGYKAVRQASCMEELQSLYLFTGVDPPASFKDTSDLAEVNEKLHFLFSVVGVE